MVTTLNTISLLGKLAFLNILMPILHGDYCVLLGKLIFSPEAK